MVKPLPSLREPFVERGGILSTAWSTWVRTIHSYFGPQEMSDLSAGYRINRGTLECFGTALTDGGGKVTVVFPRAFLIPPLVWPYGGDPLADDVAYVYGVTGTGCELWTKRSGTLIGPLPVQYWAVGLPA